VLSGGKPAALGLLCLLLMAGGTATAQAMSLQEDPSAAPREQEPMPQQREDPPPQEPDPQPDPPPDCVVPAIAQGTSQADASAAITAAHCTVGTVSTVRSEVVRGGTVSHSPAAGTVLPNASPVDLTLSAGRCVVPRVRRGSRLRTVRTALIARGCQLGTVRRMRSLTLMGRVVSAAQPAGRVLDYATRVRVNLSLGAGPRARQFAAAHRFARSRRGKVSWAVVDSSGVLHSHNGHRRYRTASVVKALILTARLRAYRNRPMPEWVKRDLRAMIRYSDNAASSRQFRMRGTARRIRQIGREARMRDLVVPSESNWGVVHFSAIDQARYFYRIRSLMPERHRSFGMTQLRSIVWWQRWGLAAADIPDNTGWRLAFKGGWLPRSCGFIEHQVGLFTRNGERFSVAVLTSCNPSAGYGRATQRGIADRLLAPAP
jgi:hypothetical protein